MPQRDTQQGAQQLFQPERYKGGISNPQRMYDAAHDPAPLMQQTLSSQTGAGALTGQVFLSHRSSRQPTKQYLAQRRFLICYLP